MTRHALVTGALLSVLLIGGCRAEHINRATAPAARSAEEGRADVAGEAFALPGAATHAAACATSASAFAETRVTTHGAHILVLAPAGHNRATPTGVVLYHHGSGGTRESLLDDPLLAGIRDQLIADGHLLVGVSGGSADWGSEASLVRYATARAWLDANYATAGVVVIGQSMGGLTAFRTAHEPAVYGFIKGVYAIYPVCDTLAVFDDTDACDTPILAAWGAADRATLAAALSGRRPVEPEASGYPRIRYRFHHSPADTVVGKAHNTDVMRSLLARRSPIENSLVVTEGEHGDPSNFNPADVSAFVAAALADPAVAP